MKEKHDVLRARIKLARVLKRNANTDHLAELLFREVYAPSDAERERFLAFSCEKDGYLSYARRPDHKYSVKSRVRIKVGRYIRQFYPTADASDEDIGLLSMTLGFAQKCDMEPKIVDSDGIIALYGESFGARSCMTGYNANKVELYAINPDKVQLAIIDAELKARALIWRCDDGSTLLDRQYGNPEACNRLYSWAKSQGWHCWQDRDKLELTVTLANRPEKWPYADTMSYMEETASGIVLRSFDSCGYHYELDRVDGNLEDAMYCCSCNDPIDDSEALYASGGTDGPFCDSCFCDRYSSCERCGDTTALDDLTTVNARRFEESWCQYCTDNSATYCNSSDQYYSTNSHQFVEVDGDLWVLSEAESHAHQWSDGTWHTDEEKTEENVEEIINEAA